jgi:hypothetical protein
MGEAYDIIRKLISDYYPVNEKVIEDWLDINEVQLLESGILDAGLKIIEKHHLFAILESYKGSYIISKRKGIRSNISEIIGNTVSVIDERYLKGLKGIEDLYLYKFIKTLEYPSEQNILIMHKELAPYAFIIDFITDRHLTSDKDKIKNFIFDNKDILNKIRRSFSSEPVKLGAGAYGTAYGIGGGKILKIFTDEFGFKKSIEAMESGRDIEARIYEVGKIGKIKYDLYYYIMEKMRPISKIDRVIEVGELIHKMYEQNFSKEEIAKFLQFMKENNIQDLWEADIESNKKIRYNKKLDEFFNQLHRDMYIKNILLKTG